MPFEAAPHPGNSHLARVEALRNIPPEELGPDEKHTLYAEIEAVLKESGGEYFDSAEEFYQLLQSRGEHDYIVRGHDPVRVLQLLSGERNELPVEYEKDAAPYENAAHFDPYSPRGLNNAFLESFGNVQGVKAVIGARNGVLVEEKLQGDRPALSRGISTDADRRHITSVHGVLSKQDLEFALFSFASGFLNEEERASELERLEEAGIDAEEKDSRLYRRNADGSLTELRVVRALLLNEEIAH